MLSIIVKPKFYGFEIVGSHFNNRCTVDSTFTAILGRHTDVQHVQPLRKYVRGQVDGIGGTILIGFGKLLLLNGRSIVVKPVFNLAGK